MIFTLPHDFNPLIRGNRRELLTVLHTWSQTLIDHYHFHCFVPAGVLSFDGRRWVASNDKFLFRVESLAREFKKRYLARVENNCGPFTLPVNGTACIAAAGDKKWIVYAKKQPFAGPEQVLEYLGRYTRRIALSNHRIKSIDNGKIVFTYKDRRHNNETKTMTLDAVEFIRRFLLHVLPKGFMKIRYYGFLANMCKKKSVLLIRRLIGKDMEVKEFIQETLREKVLRLTGRDILLCPHCKQGVMGYLCDIPSLNSG